MKYTDEQIEEIMERRGFHFYAKVNPDSKNPSYMFSSEPPENHTECSYTVEVKADGCFSFAFLRSTSTTKLSLGPCGSFENDKHFQKLRKVFEEDVALLTPSNV